MNKDIFLDSNRITKAENLLNRFQTLKAILPCINADCKRIGQLIIHGPNRSGNQTFKFKCCNTTASYQVYYNQLKTPKGAITPNVLKRKQDQSPLRETRPSNYAPKTPSPLKNLRTSVPMAQENVVPDNSIQDSTIPVEDLLHELTTLKTSLEDIQTKDNYRFTQIETDIQQLKDSQSIISTKIDKLIQILDTRAKSPAKPVTRIVPIEIESQDTPYTEVYTDASEQPVRNIERKNASPTFAEICSKYKPDQQDGIMAILQRSKRPKFLKPKNDIEQNLKVRTIYISGIPFMTLRELRGLLYNARVVMSKILNISWCGRSIVEVITTAEYGFAFSNLIKKINVWNIVSDYDPSIGLGRTDEAKERAQEGFIRRIAKAMVSSPSNTVKHFYQGIINKSEDRIKIKITKLIQELLSKEESSPVFKRSRSRESVSSQGSAKSKVSNQGSDMELSLTQDPSQEVEQANAEHQ